MPQSIHTHPKTQNKNATTLISLAFSGSARTKPDRPKNANWFTITGPVNNTDTVKLTLKEKTSYICQSQHQTPHCGATYRVKIQNSRYFAPLEA